MRIEPTEEEGLRMVLTEEREWEIFERLIVDAEGRGEGWLAKRLGVLMDDEDWDDLVAPELNDHFEKDLSIVREALRSAFDDSLQNLAHRKVEQVEGAQSDPEQEEDERDCGEILILKEDGRTWYGVFNQARLALEGKWKLAVLEDDDNDDDEFGGLDEIEPERLSAYLRSRLYMRIQSILLEMSMEL